MSAWKEWQMALKRGDLEQAEISRREYASECRMEEMYDRYEHESEEDGDDEEWD